MNFFKKLNFLVLTWALYSVDSDPAPQQDKQIDFAVGGQAVVEGVMMRSPKSVTIAVRKPDGEIEVNKKHYQTLTQRYKILNIPILRGVVNLFEMMVIGTNAINYSAAASLEEEMPEEKKESKLAQALETIMFIFSFVVGLAISLFLFKFVPLGLTTLLEGQSAFIADNYIVFNFIDGLIKMAIFLTYIYVLSLFPSFHRIFEYHGAEHKAIFNYEEKSELNVENSKRQIRFHPRCGTSFIIIVFSLSILVYTFVPKQPDFISNFALRLAILPLIAGISYEYLKLSAKHIDHAIVKALVQPGLWFQRLTTKEPDNTQLEVSIQSLEVALAMEKIKA